MCVCIRDFTAKYHKPYMREKNKSQRWREENDTKNWEGNLAHLSEKKKETFLTGSLNLLCQAFSLLDKSVCWFVFHWLCLFNLLLLLLLMLSRLLMYNFRPHQSRAFVVTICFIWWPCVHLDTRVPPMKQEMKKQAQAHSKTLAERERESQRRNVEACGWQRRAQQVEKEKEGVDLLLLPLLALCVCVSEESPARCFSLPFHLQPLERTYVWATLASLFSLLQPALFNHSPPSVCSSDPNSDAYVSVSSLIF